MNNFALFLIAAILVVIGIGAHVGPIWYSYPWRRPIWKKTYAPSLQGFKHLTILMRRLGEVHSWFGPDNNPIVHSLQRGLWEEINHMEIEQYAISSIFSKKEKERDWALRKLSAIKTKMAQDAILAISEHHSASEEIRTQAKEILRQHSREVTSRTKSSNQQKKKNGTSEHANDGRPLVVINMEDSMTKKEGDTYNIGQAGSVGPNSQAHHFQMNQDSRHNYEDMDLAELAHELEILRIELKRHSQTVEHDSAVGAVAAAEIEIKRGDRSKAKEYLKQAGSWAFDVSTKIGIGLATAALKTALGF